MSDFMNSTCDNQGVYPNQGVNPNPDEGLTAARHHWQKKCERDFKSDASHLRLFIEYLEKHYVGDPTMSIFIRVVENNIRELMDKAKARCEVWYNHIMDVLRRPGDVFCTSEEYWCRHKYRYGFGDTEERHIDTPIGTTLVEQQNNVHKSIMDKTRCEVENINHMLLYFSNYYSSDPYNPTMHLIVTTLIQRVKTAVKERARRMAQMWHYILLERCQNLYRRYPFPRSVGNWYEFPDGTVAPPDEFEDHWWNVAHRYGFQLV